MTFERRTVREELVVQVARISRPVTPTESVRVRIAEVKASYALLKRTVRQGLMSKKNA